MEALLFLGLIPGTNIQIDFTHWLMLATACALVAALYPFRKRRLGLHLLVLCAIELSTYRTKLALLA